MKGQITFVSELMVDILTLIVCVSFFVGFLFLFSNYNIYVHQNINERITIDFTNALIKDKCLTNGIIIFNATKLERKKVCINKIIGFKIVCDNKAYEFEFDENRKFLKFPVIVENYERKICVLMVNI